MQEKKIPSRTFPSPETGGPSQLEEIELSVPQQVLPGHITVSEPVREIQLLGNTVFSQDELAPLVQAFQESTRDSDALGTLIGEIDALYFKKGYLTTKTLFQGINNGVATIHVIEGKIDTVSIHGNRYNRKRQIEKALSIQSGSLLNVKELESKLNEINGSQDLYKLQAELVAGDEPGESNLVLNVQERKPYQITLMADNRGRPLIGTNTWGVGVVYDNPMGLGGQLSTGYQGARGTAVAQATYAVPVSDAGDELSFTYSYAYVNVDNREDNARLHGFAHNYGASWVHPLDEEGIYSVDLGANIRQISSTRNSKKTGETDVTSLVAGFTMDRPDKWGSTFFRTQATVAIRLLGGDSSFWKQEFNLTRVINLPHRNFLVLNGYAMVSPDSMPAYEQIGIGGATSVRGYTEGLIGGDRGFNINIEHRWPIYGLNKICPWLYERVQGVSFFDIGQAWVDKSSAGYTPGSSHLSKNNLLMGAGLGVRAALTQFLEGFADFGYGFFNRTALEVNADPTVRLHFGVRSNLIPQTYKAYNR